MRSITPRAIVVAFALLSLAACGGRQGLQTGPTAGDGSATLVVDNQAPLDMRIYAIYSGQRLRLGSVTAVQTRRLEVPASIVGAGRNLVFQADPLAGQSVASSFDIYVSPGDVITITIPPSVR